MAGDTAREPGDTFLIQDGTDRYIGQYIYGNTYTGLRRYDAERKEFVDVVPPLREFRTENAKFTKLTSREASRLPNTDSSSTTEGGKRRRRKATRKGSRKSRRTTRRKRFT